MNWAAWLASGAMSLFFRGLRIKSGLSRLSRSPFVERVVRHLPAQQSTRLLSGDRIMTSAHDYDGRILVLFGTADPKVADTCVAILRQGDVFLDIGANHGSIGLAVVPSVGAQGEVHLFEPQATLVARIASAIRPHANVHLHPIGLLDVDDTLTLERPDEHSGMGSFATVKHHQELFTTTEQCEVRDIATYLPPLLAGRPFGVKLDIEGAEGRVLPWLLQQPNLRFIVFETVALPAGMVGAIIDAGLTIYGFRRNLLSTRLTRPLDPRQPADFHDLLAFRPGVSADRLPQDASPRELAPLVA